MPLLPVKPSLNCNINISLALQKFCKDEKHNINLKGTDLVLNTSVKSIISNSDFSILENGHLETFFSNLG